MRTFLNTLIVLSLLLLSACTDKDENGIKILPQEVKVPIYIPCKIDMPQRPEFYLDLMSKDAQYEDKVKAILADVELYKIYTKELELALQHCRTVVSKS